ncbi:SH3 domain-binding glutamic acid-rich-like protein 3 [Rhopilema esculentum]|uniref:SH3 domain-binding glutamic acid-rich-like protein 3 n=1 Tax=Rhopilema esculentum TaxID=499914 RepID=UPI0031E143C1
MMSQKITLYFSTISSNQNIKKAQQRIQMVLDGKGISYEIVDIASSVEDKTKMREIVGDDTALPPQIINDGNYCGDFEAFDAAVENEELEQFLKMK